MAKKLILDISFEQSVKFENSTLSIKEEDSKKLSEKIKEVQIKKPKKVIKDENALW